MKQIRRPNGSDRITEDSHLRCLFGLHINPKPFATVQVHCYQNALLPPITYTMCEECSEKRIGRLRDEFNNIEIEHVGMVKK